MVTSSHGIVRSYSVAALVLTIKPRQTNKQCYRVIQLRGAFQFNKKYLIDTKESDLYLTEIISDIGEFSHLVDCYGVCSNNNEVSFVTNLLVLHALKRESFG